MVVRRLGSLGIICVAGLMGGVLAGCGSSTSTQGVSNLVPTTGGIPTSPGTSNNTVAAGNAPQQVQVTVNGTSETATLPAGVSLTAGENVDVIPAGATPISGLTYGPSFHKPASVTVKPAQGQGSITVNNVDTDQTLSSNGDLSGNLCFPPGEYTVTFIGPWTVTTSANANVLTINNNIVLNFPVDSNGIAGLPTAMTLNLPGNGGALTNGPYATVQMPLPDFSTGSVSLRLSDLNTYPSSISLTNTEALYNGAATIKGHRTTDFVPLNGLGSVTFIIN